MSATPGGSVRSVGRGGSPLGGAVGFTGVLDETEATPDVAAPAAATECFRDLGLEPVVQRLTVGREEYDLLPLFARIPPCASAVAYRQEICRDLERVEVRRAVDAFAQGMRAVREQLLRSQKLRNLRQAASWHLEAAGAYAATVTALAADLERADPRSRGLRALVDYLRNHLAGTGFREFARETSSLRHDLNEVTYSLFVRGSRITVAPFRRATEVRTYAAQLFDRFRSGDVTDPPVHYRERDPEMNHIEAQILEIVVRFQPELFARLSRYPHERPEFRDPVLVRFDREVEFYLAYLDLLVSLRAAGLEFCYPEVQDSPPEIYAEHTFDVALADRQVRERGTVVVNDFRLTGPERLFVVTGPNRGGKTTFARAFGQVHALGRLGLPVPGARTQIPWCDAIYTHFGREEHPEDLRGRLHDELDRFHEILARATERSLLVVNEGFASTTVSDGLLLGRRILDRALAKGTRGVYVTFLDELSTIGPSVVSMVATVSPADPTVRTYRVVRQPAEGRAYAVALAEKYGISYERLRPSRSG